METDILAIDLCRLEEACISNPVMMREWSDKLADAKREAAHAEAQLKLTYSELLKKVRQRPEAYGLDKTTDETVKAAVLCHEDHKIAVAAVIDADHAVDVLKAMTEAISDRSKQLTNACALHGQQYWSRPRADQDTQEGIRTSTMSGTGRAPKKK